MRFDRSDVCVLRLCLSLICHFVSVFRSEGGLFKAHLYFPKEYPQRPPKMRFISEFWHPNGEYVTIFFMRRPFPKHVVLLFVLCRNVVLEKKKEDHFFRRVGTVLLKIKGKGFVCKQKYFD